MDPENAAKMKSWGGWVRGGMYVQDHADTARSLRPYDSFVGPKGALLQQDPRVPSVKALGSHHESMFLRNIFIAPVRGFWSWFGGVCSLTYCNGNFRVTMVSEPFNVIL